MLGNQGFKVSITLFCQYIRARIRAYWELGRETYGCVCYAAKHPQGAYAQELCAIIMTAIMLDCVMTDLIIITYTIDILIRSIEIYKTPYFPTILSLYFSSENERSVRKI